MAYQTDAVTGLPLLDTYQDTPVPHDNGLASTDPFTPYAGTLDSRLDYCVGRRGIPYLDWGVHPGKAWVRNQFNSGPYNSIKNLANSKARVATDRQGGGGATNTPLNLIRFSDVLLWAAECEVEVGSLAKAEEYVNIVRARAADPVSWVHTYIDPTKPEAGFTDILLQIILSVYTPASLQQMANLMHVKQFVSKGDWNWMNITVILIYCVMMVMIST